MSRPALQVVAGGAAQDQRAVLTELYSKYGGAVLSRCQYLLKDRAQAEDAMQDVFAKALQSYDGFRAEASPMTWLMTIATHHCLNQLRAARAPWQALFARAEASRVEGHEGSQVVETRDLVRSLLGRLDPETQAAVIHYHVDEMTLEEVAAALKRSVPTIRKRLAQFAKLAGKEQPR